MYIKQIFRLKGKKMTSPQACIHWHTDISPDSSC